jgi:hypothetical protein
MPKILLFRVAHDLSARLVSELSRAGYDAAASESADVRTVLQLEPDLILLGVVTALAVIGVGIAVRNAQVSSKSNASLVLQLQSLRSEILTRGQLLERAQKSREAHSEELTVSVSKQLEELRAQSADLRNKISTSTGASLSDLDGRLKQTDSRRAILALLAPIDWSTTHKQLLAGPVDRYSMPAEKRSE